MMELKVNVPQIREFLNQIIQAPGKIFDFLRVDVRETMSRFLNELMESVTCFFDIETKKDKKRCSDNQ